MLQGKLCNIINILEYVHFIRKTVANANATNIESHSITFDREKVNLSTEEKNHA